MRSEKHIEAQIEKQPWKKDAGDRFSLPRAGFRDSSLYDDVLELFRQSYRDGSDTVRGSIYLGEYRYWRDVPSESLCREKISPEPLTSRILTGLLRKMIYALEKMPDGTSVSSNELLYSTSDIFFARNLGLGPSYTVIDGVFYGETLDGERSLDIEWEMCDRFDAAAQRHGFILDNVESAFKVLGMPYDVGCTYRRKSNLFLKAQEITDHDAVYDNNGRMLYKGIEWTDERGCCLMVLRIPPGVQAVRMETGQSCCQIEALSGDTLIRTHHPLFAGTPDDPSPSWIDTGEERICKGKGGLCAEADYDENGIPWPSHFTIENIGTQEAVIFISRETLFSPEEDEEDEN